MRGSRGASLAAVTRAWWVVGKAVKPYLLQRSLLIVAVAFGALLVPAASGWHALPNALLFDNWLRWDSKFYLLIAANGYGPTPWGQPTGFFPLYPWLVRICSWIMPLPLAGLLVANLAALLATGLLYALVRHMYGDELARRSIWVLLLFPTSFFLTAGYSESTYLLCAIGAVLAWRTERFGWAAVAAAGAVLARPVGIFAFTLPFVVGWLWRRRRPAVPWWCLGALAGAGVLLLAFWIAVDDPLGFLHAPTVQNLRIFNDWPDPPSRWAVLLDEGFCSNLMRRLLNWGAVALVLVASVSLWRWREYELSLLSVVSMAVPIAFHGGLFNAASMARYAVAAFPIFIVLTRWYPRGDRARAYDLGGQMLQIVLAIMFATWRWAE